VLRTAAILIALAIGEPVTGSPEELNARLKSDVAMWAGVVKKAGLQPN
jgi:tripartite-type tricarboxylate transporter receptor subunit TctC